MDFLDPRRNKAYKIRLMVGYVLMAITIGLGTLILVYGANGYGINTKNGEIIQNGLLFLDSKPGGASIYLNGKTVNHTTSDRLVLPAGAYNILLKKSGYRDWQRSFSLQELTISRFVYPFLFPQKPVANNLKTYSAQPPLLTQTPDQHWLLVQEPGTAGTFDEVDTTAIGNSETLTKPIQQLQVPDSVLTNGNSAGSVLSLVEWSSDNNNVLLKHTFSGGHEFIVFNRADPNKSFNVNKLLNINPTQVALFNKKVSQLYIYQQTGGTLSLANVDKGTLQQPILRHILAFNPYQTSIIDYITQTGVAAGLAQARIWDNGQTYPLYTFKAGSTYLLNTASYSGHTYYVAGSDTAGRVNIYKDPLSDIKNPQFGKAIPVLELEAAGASKVNFSDNARFVALQGGQDFSVYDFETQNRYQYTLKAPLTAPLQWMDGHRLMGQSAGNFFVMDYDSTNQQTLTPTATGLGGFFSGDYNHLFTLAPVSGASSIALQNVDMRAGSDLPKNPGQQ